MASRTAVQYCYLSDNDDGAAVGEVVPAILVRWMSTSILFIGSISSTIINILVANGKDPPPSEREHSKMAFIVPFESNCL